jgi:hypothetical protein
LTGGIGPANEVRAVLAHVRDGDRQPAADFAIDTDRELVGARRARVGIDPQVDPGIHDRDDLRVTAGRGSKRVGPNRRHRGMEHADLWSARPD